jgi:glutathione S-transferase
MLKLYYATGTCALATYITLEEAGADYAAERLSFKTNQQNSAEYLAINPKGRVPALVTDRGILTENPAILAYIAQTHPAKELAPLDDAYAFGKIQAFTAYLCATVHVAHAHGRRGYRWADQQSSFDDMKQKVPETMAACMGLIENEMFEGPWVAGADFSIADPYLFTISSWLESDGVDPKRFPKVLDHRNRMAQRPAVQRVLPLHQ